ISSSNIFPLHRITWRTHDEIVRVGPVRLRFWAPGFLLGRTAGPPPSLVRVGGHEVRHSETAQGQAPARLRGDEGAGRAAAWLLFAVPGHGVSHAAVAEDEGLVVAKDVEGKKVYEVTDVGRRFLDEHRDVVDDIFDRVRDAVDRTLGGGMADVNRSLGRLLKTVYRTGWRARDEATRQRLVAILDHVVGEVEALATAKSSPAA